MVFEETFNRRRFLQGGSACLGIAMQQSRAGFLWESMPDGVEVQTAFGTLRGAKSNGVLTFKGVPYAGPVDGEHRFRQAPPLQPWSGTRDALKLGPPSWQPGKTYFGIDEPTPQENCLVLTVWTPAADREAPTSHVLQPRRRIRRGFLGISFARRKRASHASMTSL